MICLRKLPNLSENYDEDEDDQYENNMVKKDELEQFVSNYRSFQKEVEKHLKCAELRQSKKVVDQAIENGQKVACPSCGLAGQREIVSFSEI